MTQQEITEGNKLIADFMGLKYSSNWVGGWFNQKGELVEQSDFNDPAVLRYHNSWDALMRVMDKIEKLGNKVEIGIASCKIYSAKYSIETIYSDTKFKAVYLHVIDFIKWYNDNINSKS